ncbi:MAG: tetratricopeptide repeat protein [Candidatus Eiseniibacteriota bacterium]
MEPSGDFDPEVAALLDSLTAAARRQPRDGEARGTLGLAYAANGLRESAAVTFDQATALAPAEPRWWYHAALARAELGDLTAAAARMDSVVSRTEDYAPAWWRRGEWAQAAGDLDRAEESFRRAAEILPDHPAGWIGLARIRLQREDAAGAAKLLEELLAREPLPTFLPYIHQLLGTAYARGGNAEAAKVHLALGLSGRPPWSDRWAKEIDDYRVSVSEKVRAAIKASRSERHEEVLAILEPLRATASDDARVLEPLGVAYFHLGRIPEAKRAFDELIAQDPDNAFAWAHLSHVHEAMDAPAEALRAARRAVELNPRIARTHRRLADVLQRLGRFDDALASYDEAIRHDPDDVDLLLAAASLAADLGREEQAAARLDRVEALRPLGEPQAREIRARLVTGSKR